MRRPAPFHEEGQKNSTKSRRRRSFVDGQVVGLISSLSSPWLRQSCGAGQGGSLLVLLVAVVSFPCGARRLFVCWCRWLYLSSSPSARSGAGVGHRLVWPFSSCCHCHRRHRFSLLFCTYKIQAAPLLIVFVFITVVSFLDGVGSRLVGLVLLVAVVIAIAVVRCSSTAMISWRSISGLGAGGRR